jgi:hypothetical protein
MLVWLVVSLSLSSLSLISSDRLEDFYQRLAKDDVKYCSDKSKMLPDCLKCIPGLEQGTGRPSCDLFVKESQEIRNEIEALTKERYGPDIPPARKFGLYPYLEKENMVVRQVTFGSMLSKKAAKNILDIGAYYNPINLFFDKSHCPASVVIVEPILDPLSAMIPCADGQGSTHIIVAPITFKVIRLIALVAVKRITTISL